MVALSLNFDLLFDNRKYKAACEPYDNIKPVRGDRSSLDPASVEAGVDMFDSEYRKEHRKILDNLFDPRASREQFNNDLK